MKTSNLIGIILLTLIFWGCEEEKNRNPVCKIINPLRGTIIPIDTTILISANVTDEDGEIDEVNFYLDNNRIASLNSFPFEYEWNIDNLLLGNHVLKAEAIDNKGATAEDTITITIAIQPGQKKWSFKAKDRLCSPVVGPDNTIYTGGYREGYFYAINPDGTEKWNIYSIHFGHPRICPAVSSDGTIYAGAYSWPDFLHAITPNGTEKWLFDKPKDIIQTSPTIDSEGIIYIGTNQGFLYAINPDGTQKWYFETEGVVSSTPAISSDGIVYVGSGEGVELKNSYFYSLTNDGSQLWKFETGTLKDVSSYEVTSTTIGLDGTIYFSIDYSYLYAINPDGTQKWRIETDGWISSSPAISSDGILYLGSGKENYYLYAINPNGSIKWKQEFENRISYSPAIGLDGTIYIAPEDNYVYAINPDGHIKWKSEHNSVITSSIAIDKNGIIYATSDDSCLIAIKGSNLSTSSSNWPMFHQNPQHTGRQE